MQEELEGSIVPGWAWIPLALCLVVPFVYQGLWFVLIGLAGAGVTALISRKREWNQSRRISLCVAALALVWMAAGGVVGGTAVLQDEELRSNVVADEAKRRQIYAAAMRRMDKIEEATEKLTEARLSGGNTSFYKSRLEMLEKSHEKQQSFTRDRYNLTDEQLRRIINEGLAERWSRSD